MREVDVAVIGGGLAGLAAAWRLRSHRLAVLEAEDRVGGRARSEERDPYWITLGPHVFGGPSSAVGTLAAETGTPMRQLTGLRAALAMNGKVITGGRIETYPFRLPLDFPSRVALLRVGLRIRAAIREYHELVLASERGGAAERERVAAFMGDLSFEEFLGPLPPDIEAMFAALAARSATEPARVAAGYGIGYFYGRAWYPERGLSQTVLGGVSRLVRGVRDALGDALGTGCAVEQVVPRADRVTVTYRKGGEVHELLARYVVVATPAHVTRRIVRDLTAERSAALDEIVYGPYVVAGLLTSERRAMPWDGVYAMSTPKRPFSLFVNTASALRDPTGPRAEGGTLMLYAGARAAEDLLDRSDDEIADRFLRSLGELYPDSRGIAREVIVRRLECGFPYPAPGHYATKPLLAEPIGRVTFAGDYLGTGHAETAVKTGFAAATTIAEQLEHRVCDTSPHPLR